MDWIPSFMLETWFLVLMVVALLVLIGVFLVVRNRRPDND
jgi:hypothetical protein